MNESRALTPEEMRERMFDQMIATLRYWRDVKDPFIPEGQTETHARMEGFLFSLLVMFDGGTAALPSFTITPAPHPDDEEFCKSTDIKWWTEAPINDTQMHEIFPWEKCR